MRIGVIVLGITALFPMCLIGQGITLNEGIDESAGNLPCYIITTPTATFYLEKTGAGLSSLVDVDGNDWISFSPEPGTGAAGEYRGFPNAIYKQDGSYFHPRNAATDSAVTRVESVSPDKIVIVATSCNGAWKGRWTFYPTHCTFTMEKMPRRYRYWILYEGTPGGQYDDDDWWMTSSKIKKRHLTTEQKHDILAPEWIAFGDQNLNRCLFLLHHQDDPYPAQFYHMEKKITVFGFGRAGMDIYLKRTPQNFSIGFVESRERTIVSRTIEQIVNMSK